MVGRKLKHPDEDRAEARRRQVVEAAAECFRREGFHGTSMAKIAKASGMSVGHIYHYFDSKEDIIAAIVELDLAQALEMFDQFSQAEGGLLGAMHDRVEHGVCDCTESTRAALMLEVMAEAARNPKVAEMVANSDRIARERFVHLLRQESPASAGEDGWEERVEILFALFQGLSIRAIRNPDLDPAAMVGLVRRVIRHVVTS